MAGSDVTWFPVKSAVCAVRLLEESAVEAVSGGCKLDPKFAVQSNTSQDAVYGRECKIDPFQLSKANSGQTSLQVVCGQLSVDQRIVK